MGKGSGRRSGRSRGVVLEVATRLRQYGKNNFMVSVTVASANAIISQDTREWLACKHTRKVGMD